MPYTVLVAGKGGTGKTTLSALLVEYLSLKYYPVLAIDADPNTNLNQLLGVELNETVVDIIDRLAQIKDNMPTGITKDRYIEYHIQEAISEGEGFDLLAMGRPEGPGCYCYANSLLRGIMEKLSKGYRAMVLDNEAGMEHLSRRLSKKADILLIVSDFSYIGLRSAKRILELARELKLEVNKEFLIVNKVREDVNDFKSKVNDFGFDNVGYIPYDENLSQLGIEGLPLSELPFNSPIKDVVVKLCNQFIGDEKM